jgi:hypothetical protein
MILAGAEDRALLESNPSAATGDGATGAEPLALLSAFPVASSGKRQTHALLEKVVLA